MDLERASDREAGRGSDRRCGSTAFLLGLLAAIVLGGALRPAVATAEPVPADATSRLDPVQTVIDSLDRMIADMDARFRAESGRPRSAIPHVTAPRRSVDSARADSRASEARAVVTANGASTAPASEDPSGDSSRRAAKAAKPNASPASASPAVVAAQENIVMRLCIAGAAFSLIWTGIAWYRTQGQGRARSAPNPIDDELPGVNGRNGHGRAGGPVPSGSPDPARSTHGGPTSSAAAPSAPRRPSRLRKLFLANLWRVKGSLVMAALFTVGGAVVELLKPWPLKVLIDHAVLGRKLPPSLGFLQTVAPDPFSVLVVAAIAIVAISAIGGAFSYSEDFITKALGYKVLYALRREVFTHLQRLSLSFHNRSRSGDLLTTFAKDTSTLKDIFAEDLLKFADQVLSMVGMLWIMWWVNWKVCLIALGSLPFLCFTLFHLYRQTKLSLKKQRKQDGRVTSRLNEVLAAMPLVQAFGREKHEEERYNHVSDETLRESIRMSRLEAAASRSSYLMSAVGTAAAALFGGMEVLQGRMMPGELVLVMSYVSSIYKPIRNLAKLSMDFSKVSASAERIAEILEVEPEIQDLPGAIGADRIRGHLAFAGVSFDYGDRKQVLSRVSFEVGPGERLALVGVSGAGKSTIASLLLRLYEAQDGAVLIDGVDIKRYRRESFRRQIGVVLQQSVLFGATIRENIAYGKPAASEEDVRAAARAANADEFIQGLDDDYDSVIGERGVTLSTGQRQRIAIARAIIRNPKILILDEPMTGLDVESEHKVREALDRLMVGKTTIMITHDLQSIADADQVLVLEDGRIVDRGTHVELIGRSGRYRELFDLGQRPAARLMARS